MIKKLFLAVLFILQCSQLAAHKTHRKKCVAKKTGLAKNKKKSSKHSHHKAPQEPESPAPYVLPQILPQEQDDLPQDQSNEFKRKIRVLLEEKTLSEEKKITLNSKEGFILESPSGSGTTVLYEEPEVTILQQAGQLYLKCRDEKYRRIKYNTIEISAINNRLRYNGHYYPGSLIIASDDKANSLMIINKLDLEDYVFCVLSSESLPSWPLEMHKIQAIACRTYAVFCMQQAITNKQKNPFYDIGNTNAHQIYKGLHNSAHLRQAVDATHNLILTYNGQIALTMFDICCGGIIPGKLRYRDTSKPYLCRTQQCQFCKGSPSYRWKQDFTFSYLTDQLKASPSLCGYLKTLGNKVVDIRIADKDQAGVVHKVTLVGAQRNVTINVRELRSALNNGHRLKSNAFTLHKSNDHIIINGSGDGHHIGLCQWGARNLLAQGWKLKKILSFYYPKTTLSRLVN